MGAEIFLISDLHLGHKNMAIHRGFQDEFEMNDLIISNWNKVVAKHDTVWVLGDITNEKSTYYYLLDQLNGYKKVVLGNHDMPQHVPELLKYVNKVCGVTELKEYWLTHIPMHPSELRNNEINICGHNHHYALEDYRYVNVSCEQVNYTPVKFSLVKHYIQNETTNYINFSQYLKAIM